MARNCATGAARGHRPAGAESLCLGIAGRAGFQPRPHPRTRRGVTARPRSAGLDLPARTEIAAVLDGAARRLRRGTRRNFTLQRKKAAKAARKPPVQGRKPARSVARIRSVKIAILSGEPRHRPRFQAQPTGRITTSDQQPQSDSGIASFARLLSRLRSRRQGDAPPGPRVPGRHEGRGQRHYRSQRQNHPSAITWS